jgi:hypothetical protein
MTTLATNVHVTTQYGPGVIQGATSAGWLVRVAVTDSNRVSLALVTCWTPKTQRSALFEIAEKELVK